MKPHRMRMTHDLLTKYDVLNQMEVPFPRYTPAALRHAAPRTATDASHAPRLGAQTGGAQGGA